MYLLYGLRLREVRLEENSGSGSLSFLGVKVKYVYLKDLRIFFNKAFDLLYEKGGLRHGQGKSPYGLGKIRAGRILPGGFQGFNLGTTTPRIPLSGPHRPEATARARGQRSPALASPTTPEIRAPASVAGIAPPRPSVCPLGARAVRGRR